MNSTVIPISEGELLHEELARVGLVGAMLHDLEQYQQAAAEFSRPYRKRITELEAENAQLRSVFVPSGSTLILIAPETASQDEMRDAAERASKVHDGPVIMLAHDWYSTSADELRARLDNFTRRELHDAFDRAAGAGPKADHIHELGSCSHCDKSKLAAVPICICPPSSEYDPPCPQHGIVGMTFSKYPDVP